jgi:truncated hemoglobin YjbI
MLTYYYIVLGLLLWCAALSIVALVLFGQVRGLRTKLDELQASLQDSDTTVAVPLPHGRRAAAGGRPGPAPVSQHAPIRPVIDQAVGGQVLQPPPTVRDSSGRAITVKDWLTHYWPGSPGWPAIVAEFYNRAASDPAIAEFFAHTDMAMLQKHFTHAMIIITKDGVNVPTRDYLARVHADLRNRAGQPISGDIYDRTINVLVEVLVDAGIPDDAINELARTVTPLRQAIVGEVAA